MFERVRILINDYFYVISHLASGKPPVKPPVKNVTKDNPDDKKKPEDSKDLNDTDEVKSGKIV